MHKKNKFTKSERLLKRHEFQKVLKEGEKKETKNFFVYMSPNFLQHDRLGIIASRKGGKTVIRNRAKRLIRENLRTFLEADKASCDVVFICKRNRSYLEFGHVERDVKKAYEKDYRGHDLRISDVSSGNIS